MYYNYLRCSFSYLLSSENSKVADDRIKTENMIFTVGPDVTLVFFFIGQFPCSVFFKTLVIRAKYEMIKILPEAVVVSAAAAVVVAARSTSLRPETT